MSKAKTAEQNGHGRLEEALAALSRSQERLSLNQEKLQERLTESQESLGRSHAAIAQAQATLIQNQAILVQTHAAFVAELRETQKDRAKFEREAQERFGRIETHMAEISRQLDEHGRLLEHLPQAVRDKMGFKVD